MFQNSSILSDCNIIIAHSLLPLSMALHGFCFAAVRCDFVGVVAVVVFFLLTQLTFYNSTFTHFAAWLNVSSCLLGGYYTTLLHVWPPLLGWLTAWLAGCLTATYKWCKSVYIYSSNSNSSSNGALVAKEAWRLHFVLFLLFLSTYILRTASTSHRTASHHASTRLLAHSFILAASQVVTQPAGETLVFYDPIWLQV